MDIVFDFDRFDELMMARGWMIADLMKAIIRNGDDITDASIRAWAARRSSPKLSNIRLLANAFGIDIQELIFSAANVEDAAKSEEPDETANGTAPAANVT